MPQTCTPPGTPLPFAHALNFRELGGYPAAGGRTVRRGLFYRSGNLDELQNPEDWPRLTALGLREILDLRSAGESAAHPDPMVPGAHSRRICAMRYADGAEMDFSPAGMARLEAERQRLGLAGGAALLRLFYGGMPFGNPAYRELFRLLEAGRTPLLFHCSAGKDRTGVAAMLILLALGAARRTAVEDYLRTNACRRPILKQLLAENAEAIRTDPAERTRLIGMAGVLREAADLTLDLMLERYGSFEAYFAAEYGLDAPRLAALRDRYLE